jgi:hypothetical protein
VIHNSFTRLLHQLEPDAVLLDYRLFDSWYASLPNLKQVRTCGWCWLTRLHGNRLATPMRSIYAC